MNASDASFLAQQGSIEASHRTSPDDAPDLVAPGGLERLYRRHAAALFRRLSRHVDREEARDLVHEAFVRIACLTPARRAAIDCPEAFATTVAKNALRDRARNAARQAASRQRLVHAETGMANDPHELMEDREALRAIDTRRLRLLHAGEPLRRLGPDPTTGAACAWP